MQGAPLGALPAKRPKEVGDCAAAATKCALPHSLCHHHGALWSLGHFAHLRAIDPQDSQRQGGHSMAHQAPLQQEQVQWFGI